ncbi:hypothetical protein OG417_31090 [Actinoallomurus sp. NBC_01490]|uniref:hypothetical protein n=1 Tax=Actinoallomurus sp. NBC_01490 TaxID=2903557 RepID=UPI002E316E64|nr:hypothetical protein [Actinoallomurus sp. NBC_01490]
MIKHHERHPAGAAPHLPSRRQPTHAKERAGLRARLSALITYTLRAPSGLPSALREYERTRSRRAGRVARLAVAEVTDRYGPMLSRLTADGLVSRHHTRWLRRISDYLATR